ncbi:MAG TPA: thiopeptide-type bacteriocin biosynthesis protein [Gemmatimonadaceae bacterium]|nr:thiopeptide-type bacteriocin biosynthesis protein [Gemmatimonadaceae bacterium]
MMVSGEERWLSAYLFFNAPIFTITCDRVVLEFIVPFVARCRAAGWISSYFFVRYGENGAHVRLRLKGTPEVIWECVRPALLDAVADADRELVSAMCFDPYIPEYDRYGGETGMPIAERAFCVSSDTAVMLLSSMDRERRATRLGQGAALLVALLHTVAGDRAHAASMAERYGKVYLRAVVPEDGTSGVLKAFSDAYDRQAERLTRQLSEVWDALASGDELPEPLETYTRGMRAARAFRSGPAVEAVTYSHAHMMNNRLGISVPEESYVAYVVHRTLGHVDA